MKNNMKVVDSKRNIDSLDNLGVIQKLEVDSVQLAPKQLKATYRITQEGKIDTLDLIYRFEEDVFKPEEAESQNLASMISVQAALNYGLFCDEMFFHGLFDKHDKNFIRKMARNTAREIFVKKFLEPNPFLSSQVKALPVIKKKSYLRCEIKFEEIEPLYFNKDITGRRKNPGWNTDPSQHAVLSSGGKESLLSFGLLKEIGYNTHPIFINESGRHWFTALNAYRYFAKDIPSTSRVWTNADRLFNWILRHLPFIRKNFAKIRSDDYPIRLWTMAIFLFGALPLLKKRGIGRLVIGNEYDTTRRTSFKGITHYDGLYDQSRFFDNEMTRYFHRKKWGISQFSILRPLSELLVEKILTERYPSLQHHQISCHAAHKKGERVQPCGRCEKCRRIVAILMAFNADPKECGYSEEQIKQCLKNLAVNGINLEIEGVEQLGLMLTKKKLIKKPSIASISSNERPQFLKLRFDSEKSSVENFSVDLRKPLYRIYLEHAEGAVNKKGQRWIDFDLMNDPAIGRPYPFESAQAFQNIIEHFEKPTATSQSSYLLGELTWPEAKRRFMKMDVALLPVGAIEQHGPHLPLDLDAFDADYIARQVAECCTDPKPIILPLIPYGVSYHHEDFSGTVSISPETLSQLVYDIGMSVFKHGITKLVIINGHGGNSPALHFAAQMINRDAHIFTCVDTGESSDSDIYAITETPNDVHAGEIETSTALASRPNLVRLDKARKFVPRFSNRYLDFTSKRSVGWYAHTSKISPSGVLGDPTKATREKGEIFWDLTIKHLVEFIEDLKNLTLDEIYQKRY